MKPTHWMPLYIGDYLRDTLGLGRAEHGSYMLLIMAYWANGGALANDDGTLREIAKCPEHEWTRTRGLMLRFFKVEGDHWTHKRINEELKEAQSSYVTKLDASRKGVEARRTLGQLPKEPPVQPVVQPPVQPPENTTTTTTIDTHIGETEPPVGFPKTEREAVEIGKMVGCSEAVSVMEYHKAVSRGYADAKGQIIRKFASYLKIAQTYENNRTANQKRNDRNAGTYNEGRSSAGISAKVR